MKNLKFSTEDYVLGAVAAFLLAVLWMGSFGSGGAKSPEELGENVFKALKSNELGSLTGSLVRVADLKFMLESSDVPEEAKAKGLKQIQEKGEKIEKEWHQYSQSAMSEIQSLGIEPPRMEMGTIQVELKMNGKVEEADIVVPIMEGTRKGELRMFGIKHGQWRAMPPFRFSVKTAD
jgi:hypothetical protein